MLRNFQVETFLVLSLVDDGTASLFQQIPNLICTKSRFSSKGLKL